MNPKLRKLLNQINAKKIEVQDLVDQDKIEEAKAAKAELQKLQDKFDLLKDVEDSEYDEAVNEIREGSAILVSPAEGETADSFAAAQKEFADAFRGGFRNGMSEGTSADGGYTVPEAIETKIRERRDAKMSLRQEVEVVPVRTMSGARTYKKRSQQTGFTLVTEGGAIGAKATPQFERLPWAIKKYGGYFPVTDELLEDSDANITSILTEWVGDESRVTDNVTIMAAITGNLTPYNISSLDDIKDVLNVRLGQAFKPTSKIYTNDDGLQWLDTLKDKDDRYLLSPMPSDPMKMVLAAGATRVQVEVYPNAEMPSDVSVPGTRTIPMIIGDMKEAVVLFDRKRTSLKWTDVASVGNLNAFENDLTLLRAILRQDVEIKDDQAIEYCLLSIVDTAQYSYEAVTPKGTENPSEEGWFERSGNAGSYVYTLTDDTTIQNGVTYYERIAL